MVGADLSLSEWEAEDKQEEEAGMIYVVIKSELETSERTHELTSSLMQTQMATYRNTYRDR